MAVLVEAVSEVAAAPADVAELGGPPIVEPEPEPAPVPGPVIVPVLAPAPGHVGVVSEPRKACVIKPLVFDFETEPESPRG